MLALNLIDDYVNFRSVVDDLLNKSSSAGEKTRADLPLVKIFEKGDEISVEMVVPGVIKEDISLNLTEDQLHIEVKKARDESGKRYIRKERVFGSFKKSIKMPYRVDHNEIKAQLSDGILTVSLQKSEEAKPKKIDIR